jgi:hypothetical protein
MYSVSQLRVRSESTKRQVSVWLTALRAAPLSSSSALDTALYIQNEEDRSSLLISAHYMQRFAVI